MTEMQMEKRKKIITNKGYKEYQQALQHKEISEIMQTGNLQHQYDLWSHYWRHHKESWKDNQKRT